MTEAQSVGLVIAACFLFIYGVSNSKTYKILAVIYAINAALHFGFSSVQSYSAWWPALSSTLDVCALAAILAIGDIRVKFQMLCLSALIMMHALLSYDLAFQANSVFSFYYQTVLTIIAAQIIAGFHDARAEHRRVNCPANNANKRRHHVKNNHQGANP